MPPPDRTKPGDYHFHVYDYDKSAPWQLSHGQPERKGWQFYSMVQDLAGLRDYGRERGIPNIELTNLGQLITDEPPPNAHGRYIQALSFGGPKDDQKKLADTPEVLITGGIHAREWVAPEMAYLLAEYLIKNYPDANVTKPNRYQKGIQSIVDARRIYIIPLLNPVGNFYTVFSPDKGARLWRRNRHPLPQSGSAWVAALTAELRPRPPFKNVQAKGSTATYDVPRYNSTHIDSVTLPNNAGPGVDLNRNFSTPSYGYSTTSRSGSSSAMPDTEGYFGPGSASELETKNVQQFVAGLGKLKTSIDYHAFGQVILYTTELHDTGRVDENFRLLGQSLQVLINPANPVEGQYDYVLGTPLQAFGYDGTGSIADYIGVQKQARSFVIELDPKQGDKTGFRLPEDQIQTVFEKNIRGALALIAAAGPQEQKIFGQTPITSGALRLLDWNVFGRGNQLPK